jgi:hypothetical protein
VDRVDAATHDDMRSTAHRSGDRQEHRVGAIARAEVPDPWFRPSREEVSVRV